MLCFLMLADRRVRGYRTLANLQITQQFTKFGVCRILLACYASHVTNVGISVYIQAFLTHVKSVV
jgi:hypothetical protein